MLVGLWTSPASAVVRPGDAAAAGVGTSRLPAPLMNCPIRAKDDGRLLGIADLLDEDAGLVVEYDGADHRGAARQTDDLDREHRFREHRPEVCRVTGLALRDRDALATRPRTTHSPALFEQPRARSWWADPPADTLDDELDRAAALADLHDELDRQPLPTAEEMSRW